MSAGAQLEKLWMDLQRSLSPFNLMFAQAKVSRKKAMLAIDDARAALDAMERILKGTAK